ncbi:MAG: hypothetical protein IPH07_15330 [Deltaproteobacteria bacterium]|nr:hypothetical protein [Deltaproteobacteria bacterium]MBK8239150.1 hypothetical protein [Deltaproteobacteria bacterium]MBK8717665.1 hypothetical protein [Deltaproteobacteria bacterium]MBP7285730.1 hypothetical protein [Nannocystaceae bacterium]
MHPLYANESFAGVDPIAFDLWAWFNVVGALGCVCWVIAYVAIIRRSRRDRANGLPMTAVGLNFSWELLASLFLPNPVALWHAFDRIWLLVDVVIVAQTLRYGPPLQRLELVRRHYIAAFALVFVLGFVGQYTFALDYPDRLGLVAAFMINLVMSVLFVVMALERWDDPRGLSTTGAWFKMLGTLGTSIECHVVVRLIDPELGGLGFLTFLSAAIFGFDCAYIALVTIANRRHPRVT